ncbi:MAG: Ig-like domain-containing protein, partial [Sulfurovaceae bacterium]
ADGTTTVDVSATDTAGNTGTGSGSVTVDATAPDIDQLKITNIVDNTGNYSSVTMYGTGAEVGNTIAIYDEDDNLVATATVQSDGTWSVDISNLSNTPIGDNEFFSVTETDAAGNTTGQTDSTHYYHGDGSSISTESTDDYVLTGDGNDTINTDQVVAASGNEDDTDDYVMIDGGNGTDTVNFGGNISDYTITTDVNGNIIVTEMATSDSNGDGIGDVTELRNIETIVFADGTYNVTTSNFIPTSTNDSITILEDMNNTTDVYTLTTNDFGTYSDEEGDSLAFIRIDSLPTNGTLYLDGIVVTAGTVIEVADITSGLLTFNPIDNNDTNSSFTFSVHDGTDWSTTSYATAINITAVADTPTLTVDGIQSSGGDDLIDLVTIPSSTGLTQQIYDNVSSVTIDSVNLEATIDGLSPTSQTVVTQPYATGNNGTEADDIAAGTIEVTSGLIYLEAGTTISFSGYFDDSLQIELGGTTLVSTTGDAYGQYNTSIVGATTAGGGIATTNGAYIVSESGYYTLDIYTYNHGGPGDLSINVSVDGATPVALDTTNFNLYSNAADIDGQHSSLVSTDGENGYYPVALNEGVEGSPIKLTSISAALTDTDGSETLSITISDIPVGCTISDGTNTFTATSGSTTIDVTNWNLDSLIYTASDVSSSGSINELTVTATATEGANGDTASASETITVTINTAPVAVADQAVINMPDSTATTYYVSSTEEIGTVDLTTGVQTVIGTPGYTHGTIYDIAATSSGTLYAITSTDRLYSIDTSTAAATSIGNVRTSSNQDVGTIVGLAFSADDTLYGMTNDGHLYSINTSSGVATSVAPYDFGGTCDDLVYYDNGLYVLADNKLLRYDLTTGSVSTIVTGMNGILYGLALNDDGNIYVIKNDGTAYIVDLTDNTYTSANNIDLSGTIYGAASTTMAATIVTATGDVTPETTGQDHDADGDSFSVTGVLAGSTMSASGSVGAEIQGTYGTLVMQADGSYTYTLDKSLTAGAKNAYEEASDRVFYYVDNGGNIGTVDPENGATTVIGYSGHTFYDIAITPNGTLYGIMGNGDLYSINTSTATSTSIGTANVSGEIRGLVSDSDGTLYALTYYGDLYTIDATTGAATYVDGLGGYYCDDILYYDGDIYALSNGNLLKYDLDTGTVTTVVTGMPNNMYGIGIDSDGSIYAFQYYGNIYAIDLDAGTAADTGVDVDDYIYGVSSAFNDLSATAFYATDTFTYTITDEDGMTSTTTLTINVTDPDTTSITGSITDTVLTGDSDSNIIISNNSDGAELYGGDGNDILIGMEGVADSLYGGDGNDILVYDASDVVVDGGNGSDVLIFNTDTTLDFGTLNSSTNPITNIETLDLTDASVTLDHLSAADVLDITGNSDTTLKILGDSDDTVNLDGWTTSGQTNQDGITYNVYTDTSGTSTQIWVQADVGHIVL